MEVTKLQLNGNEYNLTDADAQSKISEIKSSTYTKEFVDLALSDIDESLKDYAKSADVAVNYQPKGNYLTQHQSLQNYYTKSEVDNAIDAIPAYDDTNLSNRVSSLEAIDHSQYLTEHLDISGLATKAEVKTVSDKVNAIKVPTKVSELTNDSKYQTESLVNSAIQKVVGAAPEALDTLEEIAGKLNDNDDVVAGLVSTVSTKADKSALNNYYKKSEVDDKIDAIDFTPFETVEGAAGKYQPIGSYVKVDGSNGTNAGVSTLLRKLGDGDKVMTDNTLLVTSYFSGQTTENPLFYRRPANLLWSYIKGKADSIYLKEHQSLEDYLTKEDAVETYQPKGSYLSTTGGTITGEIKVTQIRGTGSDNNFIIGNDTNGASGVPADCWFVGNYQKAGYIRSTGDLKHYDSNKGTYTILDSGNYDSYALPLSGGKMSGLIRFNKGSQANDPSRGIAFIDDNGDYISMINSSTILGLYGTNYIALRVIDADNINDINSYSNIANIGMAIYKDKVIFNNKPIPTIWTGTEAQYNALTTKDSNTLYLIPE